jgi:hypothetical protein
MAFKPTTISQEESNDIKTDLNDSITVQVNETKSSLQKDLDSERKKKEAKPRKKTQKKDFFASVDPVVEQAGIEEQKWRNYKKDLLVKPMELIEDVNQRTVCVPAVLLDKLNDLQKYSQRIHTKTILANLIVDFFERNGDIIELMNNEYKKGKK